MKEQEAIEITASPQWRTQVLQLYQEQYVPLKHLSYGIVHSEADAEDVVQDVFAQLLLDEAKFRGESSLRTYVHRMVINRSLNHNRFNRVRGRFALGGSTTPELATQLLERQADEDHTDHQQAEVDHLRHLQYLHQAIDLLPRRQAQVIALFYYERLSQQEIATMMQTSVGAVEQLVSRAKANLSTALNKKIRQAEKEDYERYLK